jgi:hypothetical protein
MRIYVFGKGEEVHHIKRLMSSLEKEGHKITYDWTNEWKQYFGNGKKSKVSEEVLDEIARNEISGINDANVVVGYVWHELPYRSSYAELGISIVFGKKVFLLGTGMDKCDFSYHSQVKRVKNQSALMKILRGM